jgi:hypothetical protein
MGAARKTSFAALERAFKKNYVTITTYIKSCRKKSGDKWGKNFVRKRPVSEKSSAGKGWRQVSALYSQCTLLPVFCCFSVH